MGWKLNARGVGAGLYKREDFKAIFNLSMKAGVGLFDRKKVKGNEIPVEHWLTTAAKTFAQSFDDELFRLMQNELDAEQIQQEFKGIMKNSGKIKLAPRLADLPGGERERPGVHRKIKRQSRAGYGT